MINKDRLRTSVISQKYGWYLARVNASIENFANIVVTSLNTIYKFHLKPGRNVRIANLAKGASKINFLDKFILLPYFEEFIKNYYLLQNILKSLTNITYICVDKDYINKIIKLMSNFYQNREDKSVIRIREFFEFDNPDNYQLDIALPDSWLNQNSIDLGEIVLLRNDEPSPVIL